MIKSARSWPDLLHEDGGQGLNLIFLLLAQPIICLLRVRMRNYMDTVHRPKGNRKGVEASGPTRWVVFCGHPEFHQTPIDTPMGGAGSWNSSLSFLCHSLIQRPVGFIPLH